MITMILPSSCYDAGLGADAVVSTNGRVNFAPSNSQRTLLHASRTTAEASGDGRKNPFAQKQNRTKKVARGKKKQTKENPESKPPHVGGFLLGGDDEDHPSGSPTASSPTGSPTVSLIASSIAGQGDSLQDGSELEKGGFTVDGIMLAATDETSGAEALFCCSVTPAILTIGTMLAIAALGDLW